MSPSVSKTASSSSLTAAADGVPLLEELLRRQALLVVKAATDGDESKKLFPQSRERTVQLDPPMNADTRRTNTPPKHGDAGLVGTPGERSEPEVDRRLGDEGVP